MQLFNYEHTRKKGKKLEQDLHQESSNIFTKLFLMEAFRAVKRDLLQQKIHKFYLCTDQGISMSIG